MRCAAVAADGREEAKWKHGTAHGCPAFPCFLTIGESRRKPHPDQKKKEEGGDADQAQGTAAFFSYAATWGSSRFHLKLP